MRLPEGFSLAMPGGVMIATHDACGERSERILPRGDGHEQIEQWCSGHHCSVMPPAYDEQPERNHTAIP